MTETVAQLLALHRSGEMSPTETVRRTFARLLAADDPAMFIGLRAEEELLAEAAALDAPGKRDLSLFGIPVAVKDNIDVAGLPTTAACPARPAPPPRPATLPPHAGR